MKPLLLALLLYTALPAIATAQTSVTGFNPRFSTTPDNPDDPDFHQPPRQPSRFDIGVDVSPYQNGPWRYRDRDRCRDRRDCRRGRRN